MCGIAGVALFDRARAEALERRARAMRAALRHRGPDAEAIWSDAEAGVALVHLRLSIQDLSDAGAQPMHSACGRLLLVYNGECYNAPELRDELSALGHRFRGHSDTEVILAGFSEWGFEETLNRMVGMFAIALWDRSDRTLMLARDRLGIKPLYWREEPGGIAFASELKGLLAGVSHPPISQAGLASYLRHGYIQAPLTIHQGVHQLLPGHVLRLRPGGAPRITPFWSLADVLAGIAPQDRIADPAEGRALIEAELGRAVRQRLLSDVPLGAFLSGGIDSSLITALMVEQADGPVDSYSIGSPDGTYDEAVHAREVARHLGTRHHELTVTEQDCLAEIPRLMETWDEPFADSSQVPTLVLSRLARAHVAVALSGDGGDELFAGYNRHRWHQRLSGLRGRPQGRLLGLAAGAAGALPAGVTDRLGRAATGQSGVARRLSKLGAMLGAADAAAAHEAAVTLWSGLGPAPQPLAAYRIAADMNGFSEAERMQAIDCLTYLPNDILTKVDRASMAVALEVRVPFLDHRVVAAAFRLAPDLKLRGGTTKWMLRQMLYDRVPRGLVDRPKQGFAIPLESWLKGRLRDWAEDLLRGTDWTGRFGIDPAPIRTAWSRHLSGRPGETDRLWAVLMLAAWARKEADAQAQPVPVVA